MKLLYATILPDEVAVFKCAAHTRKADDISRGNNFADTTAKETGQGHSGLTQSGLQ